MAWLIAIVIGVVALGTATMAGIGIGVAKGDRDDVAIFTCLGVSMLLLFAALWVVS